MSYANLTKAKFGLMNNFSHADLQYASGIPDQAFQSALSLENTYLPNGTLIQNQSKLLRNGHADCNTLVINDWTIHEGQISVRPSLQNDNNCYFFALNASNNSFSHMSQRVNIIVVIVLLCQIIEQLLYIELV